MKMRFVTRPQILALPVALVLSLTFTAPVWAQAPASLDSLLACRAIPGDIARLDCFDRESRAVAMARASTATPAAGSATAATQPAGTTWPTPSTPPTGSAPPAATSAAASPTAPTPASALTSPAAPASAAQPAGSAAALDPVATFGLPSQTIAAKETEAGLRKKDVQSITAHIARISSGSSGRTVFNLDNHQVWQEVGAEGDLMAKPGDEVKIWRGMLGSFWLQAATGRGCKVSRLE